MKLLFYKEKLFKALCFYKKKFYLWYLIVKKLSQGFLPDCSVMFLVWKYIWNILLWCKICPSDFMNIFSMIISNNKLFEYISFNWLDLSFKTLKKYTGFKIALFHKFVLILVIRNGEVEYINFIPAMHSNSRFAQEPTCFVDSDTWKVIEF